MMKCTNSYNYYTKIMTMIFWMLISRCFIIDQWLILPQYFIRSPLYFFINMEENILESQIACHTFLCFFPTKFNMKFSNGNTVHVQGVSIILCHFPNCSIIYQVVPFYYCKGHPSNTILAGALKCYAGFQKVTSETLEHFYFFDPRGRSWRSPCQTRNNIYYLQIKMPN